LKNRVTLLIIRVLSWTTERLYEIHGGPKKLSTKESSVNRIKTVKLILISRKFANFFGPPCIQLRF